LASLPLAEQLVSASHQASPLRSLQARDARRASGGPRRAHLHQQVFDRLRPGLLEVLGHPGQLAPLVDMAERRAAGVVLPRGRPAVVDGRAAEVGEPANGLGGGAPPLGM
jgi:hypothetical protein